MDAYKDIFLSESAEFIQGITDGLLALERAPDDREPVEVVFRGAHSLKGMAAAMGYAQTADLTHKMESLMARVREREREVDHELIDLMLEAVDAVRELIDAESSGADTVDVSALVARLVRSAEAPADDDAVQDQGQATVAGPSDGQTLRVSCVLDGECVLKAVRAYMVIKRLSHMGTVVDTVPSGRDIEDERFEREFAVILSTPASAEEVCDAARGVSEVESARAELLEPAQKPARPDAGPHAGQAPRRAAIPKLSETQTVRIAIGHLDTMVDLVGELVILRARLERIADDLDLHDFDEVIEDLHRVSGDLQHEVMQTRMVPVGNIFNRFPRMVRDLARDLDKDVAFEVEGVDIELDRTVLDEIGDPIVHLLRNSIDHGIEPAEERKQAGKPESGTIRLVAARERDRVRITVTDDGRGIDCERVWDKACALGLVDPAARSSYSDDDVLLLTCTPGFSTVQEATKVSGRGVGMDVVKGKIEHLGGTLSIVSRPGQGTDFSLILPLTLAIIQALLVGSGEQTYALPLSSVEEVLAPGDMPVETVNGAPVVIGRDGEAVPLHYLDVLLGRERNGMRLPRPGEGIVLLESGGQERALGVERLLGRREIVIKPLSRMFSGVRGIGGATVLGDGRVALIIDPRSVFPSREETP